MRVLFVAVCVIVLAGCNGITTSPAPQEDTSCLQITLVETGDAVLSNVCAQQSITVINLKTGETIVLEPGTSQEQSGQSFSVVKQ